MPDLPDRRKHEQRLADAIARRFDEQRARLESDSSAGFQQFENDLQRDLSAELAIVFVLAMMVLDDEYRVGITTQLAQQRAHAWSANASRVLSQSIADTSRDRVASAFDAAASSPDPVRARRDALAEVFRRGRADSIAATEVTRGTSAGESAGVAVASSVGVSLQPIWETERDARVCPICSPLQGTGVDRWGRLYPGGPPAHPNCRCWLRYRQGTIGPRPAPFSIRTI